MLPVVVPSIPSESSHLTITIVAQFTNTTVCPSCIAAEQAIALRTNTMEIAHHAFTPIAAAITAVVLPAAFTPIIVSAPAAALIMAAQTSIVQVTAAQTSTVQVTAVRTSAVLMPAAPAIVEAVAQVAAQVAAANRV